MEKKYYGAVDELRVTAAFAIVMMHIKSNSQYEISGFIYNHLIASFGNFVFLFMTLSAFGLCCGYYELILKNQLSIVAFYGKRFRRIFPFFSLLILLDLVISPSVSSLYEGFADLTLLFGFLPDAGNISVIGVGWFLGLIFVFYICFPFFCVLLENKKRAWIAFGISIVYNFVCTIYFHVGRTNILYSACFFLAGGLIYLYRNEISYFNKNTILIVLGMLIVLYYLIGKNTIIWLPLSAVLLTSAIHTKNAGGGVFATGIIRFFNNISMEIYLSHMVIFRIIEKTGLQYIGGNGWLQYIATVVMVLAGTAVFAVLIRRVFSFIRYRTVEVKAKLEQSLY